MPSNIIQTLINTRVENSAEDVGEWVDRLTDLGDEIKYDRGADPSLLTQNEAEVLVRYYGTQQPRREIADAMNISPNRIDNLRRAAEGNLLAAEATLAVVSELRKQVRPDPY